MSNVAFTRQLGEESGVQLNPLRDATELPAGTQADQVFAIPARLTRGRIDRPFLVDRGTLKALCGPGESIRANALNEAWAQMYEALNNGAPAAVVVRLITGAASNKWVLWNVTSNAWAATLSASIATPSTGFKIALLDKNCHNDGIKWSIHADENPVSGVNAAATVVTVRRHDSAGSVLDEFTGSLQDGSTDDYGNSDYLPDVIASRTDTIECLVAGNTSVSPSDDCYGYTASGTQKWVISALLTPFAEGGTAYQASDYQAAVAKLQATTLEFGYLLSGGSQATALLTALGGLAFEFNLMLVLDVPGNLAPSAAITWVDGLGLSDSEKGHLIHMYWAPLKTADPSGISAKGYLGTGGFQVAKRCLRNAQTDASGFAPKHYPIAGALWPLARASTTQIYTPSQQEKNQLAKARINPVIYETYAQGARFAFVDSLTSAPVKNSYKKLISVAETSADIDHRVTRMGKSVLQLPMPVAINRLTRDIEQMFRGARSAGWIEPSEELQGAAYQYTVTPNLARPMDRLDVNYWVRYVGTVRAIFVTQTLSL